MIVITKRHGLQAAPSSESLCLPVCLHVCLSACLHVGTHTRVFVYIYVSVVYWEQALAEARYSAFQGELFQLQTGVLLPKCSPLKQAEPQKDKVFRGCQLDGNSVSKWVKSWQGARDGWHGACQCLMISVGSGQPLPGALRRPGGVQLWGWLQERWWRRQTGGWGAPTQVGIQPHGSTSRC